MSESTLSLGFTDFQRNVGRLAGYGGTPANWSADQLAEVDDVIQSGIRKFYNPPAINGKVHLWSFLEPISTITTIPTYSTGTVSSVSTAVTLTTGTWPTWAATNGTLEVDNVDYAIASRTSGSIIVLSSAPSVAFSSDSFKLKHNGNYTLPDNFGVLNGYLHFPNTSPYKPIKITSDKNINQMRSEYDDERNPEYAAIKFLNSTSATAGQRMELMLYPRPSDEWILTYKYRVLLNKLTSELPYPLGGGQHSETILEAILSVMEQRMDNKIGLHTQNFMQLLQASIELDASQAPEYIGYNGDCSDEEDVYFRDTIYGIANNITVSLT